MSLIPEKPAILSCEEIASDLYQLGEEFTRAVGWVAAEMATVAGRVNAERDNMLADTKELERLLAEEKQRHIDDVDVLNARVAEERDARATAERMMHRFRFALWTYLQERDGPAGIHAPSHDTLRLIRELVKELE